MPNQNTGGWAADRTVTTADAAPSSSSDGVDVEDGDIFAVNVQLM
jgi:hypothetical protein